MSTSSTITSTDMIGTILKGVFNLGGLFLRNKGRKEVNRQDDQLSARESFGPVTEGRTWFDVLVDALNRLPRPLLAFEAIALLHWAVLDPPGFAAAMTAFALVPEWLALVIAQIVLLYFGGRMLDKWPRKMKGPTPKEVKEVVENIEELKRIKSDMGEPDQSGKSSEKS